MLETPSLLLASVWSNMKLLSRNAIVLINTSQTVFLTVNGTYFSLMKLGFTTLFNAMILRLSLTMNISHFSIRKN